MASIEIVVACGYLRNLARRIGETQEFMREFSCLASDALYSAPPVRAAYNDFSKKWDEKRLELADELEGTANSIKLTADEFEKADATLAEAVRPC